MSVTPSPRANTNVRAAAALNALREHLVAQGDDLIIAAGQIGGPLWQYHAEMFVLALLREAPIGSWAMALLEALHRLLTQAHAPAPQQDQADAERLTFFGMCAGSSGRHAQALGDALQALRSANAASRPAGRGTRVLVRADRDDSPGQRTVGGRADPCKVGIGPSKSA